MIPGFPRHQGFPTTSISARARRATGAYATALALLLLAPAGVPAQEEEPAPETPSPRNPRVVLEVRGMHYDAGDPVLVRVSVHNDGDETVPNPLPDPLPRGFVLTDARGETHRPQELGRAVPAERPERLAPGAYFGRVLDVGRHFPVLASPGRYTLAFGEGDAAANSVEVNVIPEYNPDADYTATIKTRLGSLVIELFSEDAPLTARNFVDLARQGFYDGLVFHYVQPGEIVIGGDPRGDGSGGSGFSLPPEFNQRQHLAGTVGMVRGTDPASASSQFYICLSPQPERDGRFTVFGQVVEGMDVLGKMGEVPTSGRQDPPYFRPLEPLVIEAISIRETPRSQAEAS